MELRKAWCRETAHPSYQNKWSADNPSYGQCAVSCLAMQDIYGGDIYECKVNGKRHYVNILPQGTMYDFTAEQFNIKCIKYDDMKPRTRSSLLKSASVKERYLMLKARLEDN